MDLANRIAAVIAERLGYDDEQRAVMAYGLGAAIQMLQLLLIAFIFGIFFDCLIETMIIFWGVGLLRRTTGGEHCRTYMACILTSSLSVCLLSFVCRYLLPGYLPVWNYILFGIIPAFGCFVWIAYKRVPKAAPNKPIDNPVKIKRLRRQCFTTVIIYLILAIVLLSLNWSDKRNISAFSALMAVLWWQSFTLTSWSSRLAQSMDRLFANDDD